MQQVANHRLLEVVAEPDDRRAGPVAGCLHSLEGADGEGLQTSKGEVRRPLARHGQREGEGLLVRRLVVLLGQGADEGSAVLQVVGLDDIQAQLGNAPIDLVDALSACVVHGFANHLEGVEMIGNVHDLRISARDHESKTWIEYTVMHRGRHGVRLHVIDQHKGLLVLLAERLREFQSRSETWRESGPNRQRNCIDILLNA